MKVYIWEGVLTDWTDGMIVVIANNKKEALEQIAEEWDPKDSWSHYDYIAKTKPTVYDMNSRKKPAMHYVYGGA